jgi:hypothetical protein
MQFVSTGIWYCGGYVNGVGGYQFDYVAFSLFRTLRI